MTNLLGRKDLLDQLTIVIENKDTVCRRIVADVFVDNIPFYLLGSGIMT